VSLMFEESEKFGQNKRNLSGVTIREQKKSWIIECGKKSCFRCGDEITMYYGGRNNSQLVFRSGFMNGDR